MKDGGSIYCRYFTEAESNIDIDLYKLGQSLKVFFD